MTAQILDGKALAGQIRAELAQRVAALAGRGIVPGLGTVLVGDDPGSRAYVNGKHRDCAQVGIASLRRDLPEDATQAQVEAVVDELNADAACTGYIVQLPLPAGLDAHAVLNRMDPAKDADGLHPANLGKLVLGEPGPLPCTPRGIVELLRRYGVAVAGADVTVIGRGITVGRALGLLLTRRTENATVTLCHTGTKDLAAHTRTADIVVVAAGRPGLLDDLEGIGILAPTGYGDGETLKFAHRTFFDYLAARAFAESSVSSTDSWMMLFASTLRRTGTSRPRSVSTAMPMCTYFL